MSRFNIKTTMLWRATILRRYVRALSNQLPCRKISKSIRYRQLQPPPPPRPNSSTPALEIEIPTAETSSPRCCDHDHAQDSSDFVALKITLLGDCQIGKTCFLTKYVGRERNEEGFETTGSSQKIEKILCVRGARIAYNIWEVAGDDNSQNHIPVACKDSVAMIFMFDLTSRCTLNSVISWYQEARKWNQTAIPVIVGTKFDDFIQLPIALQWTIASQARSYARALNATLFFSSATYNINVNKIFKFITAKLFNLPWNVERNVTIGEPIIDF